MLRVPLAAEPGTTKALGTGVWQPVVLGQLREELLTQRLQDACWNVTHGPSPVAEHQQLHEGAVPVSLPRPPVPMTYHGL